MRCGSALVLLVALLAVGVAAAKDLRHATVNEIVPEGVLSSEEPDPYETGSADDYNPDPDADEDTVPDDDEAPAPDVAASLDTGNDGVVDHTDTSLSPEGHYSLGESRRRIGAGFQPWTAPPPPADDYKPMDDPIFNKEKLNPEYAANTDTDKFDEDKLKQAEKDTHVTHARVPHNSTENQTLSHSQEASYENWATGTGSEVTPL